MIKRRVGMCSALTKHDVCDLSGVSFTVETTSQQETVNLHVVTST